MAEHDVRDRLGEFLYRIHGETGAARFYWPPWRTHTEAVRERWRAAAESGLPALAASCGFKIVDDDGETK